MRLHMTRTTKKIILFSLLGVIAIGVGVGYRIYNKGLINVEQSSPDVKASAIELYQAFYTDSLTAIKKFSRKDEIVEVTGIISSISLNLQNNSVILLKTNEPDAFVNCTMVGNLENTKEGNTITLKGICIGINSDLGLLGDVYIIRGYLVK